MVPDVMFDVLKVKSLTKGVLECRDLISAGHKLFHQVKACQLLCMAHSKQIYARNMSASELQKVLDTGSVFKIQKGFH